MMVNFRANAPKSFAGSPVVLIKDYDDLNQTEVKTGNVVKMDFPATSNVLQYFCEDGTKISVRPSGTEPKIKFYIEVKGKMKDVNDYDRATRDAKQKVESIKKELGI